MTDNFSQYQKKQIAEMRPYVQYEDMTNISVGPEDARRGSPKLGDMIARNPLNHNDQWLVSEEYFKANFELI
jgi:hypothetical protein